MHSAACRATRYNRGMVQPQLEEYISSQVKMGVSRDAIKAALVGAGWAAADVDDTLKKMDGGMAASSGPAVSAVSPASSSGLAASASAKPLGNSPLGASPMGGVRPISINVGAGSGSAAPKEVAPQSIRVSDLVSSSSASFGGGMNSGKTQAQAEKIFSKPAAGMSFGGAQGMMTETKKRSPLMMIVGIVIIVALAGFSGWLYFQNMGLASQVAAIGGTSASVGSDVTSLQNQVSMLNASNTALAAQVASMTDANALLGANLSFAATAPAWAGAQNATETVTLAGRLAMGRSLYFLTTPYGIVAYVENSKDANTAAALKPLAGTTTTVTLAGTHVPGSQYLTVTAVNGAVLGATTTAPAATSSAAAPMIPATTTTSTTP